MVAPAMPKRPAAFDLKGTMAPLTVLRLRSSDIQLVERQLRMKIAQLPQLFLHAPVLIDLGALEEASPLTVIQVVAILRACKLVPVAVTNVAEAMRGRRSPTRASASCRRRPRRARPRARRRDRRDPGPGSDARARSGRRRPQPVARPVPPPRRARRRPRRPAPVIKRPPTAGRWSSASRCAAARSSTRRTPTWSCWRRSTPGAQVIADGHVHIYATLRGRAVAGAQGLPGARIFCQSLEAELVAVSGAYLTADEIPAARARQARRRSASRTASAEVAPL